jgi:CGNR zinc finger/Putative stress-induced transcription regulator
MTGRTNQVAPGTLEIVRAFLNTWLVPNDTREPTDLLDSREAMEQFYSIWFEHDDNQEIAIDPAQVWRLRADLRALLGQGDLQALSAWLAAYPVEAELTRNEDGVSRVAYRPGKTTDCALCAAMLAAVVEAIARSTWARLKACPDCQWVFYDHTKNQSKVWCLMTASGPQGRSCGSIAKVRAYRQRRKASEAEVSSASDHA